MFNLFCFFKVILNFFFRILSPMNSFLSERYAFEAGNTLDGHESFALEGQQADILYEVSSEGELEQVRSLIERDLQANKKVELVYFSNSVTHQCLKLQKAYAQQLRLFRYPVLSFNPLFQKTTNSLQSWATAPTIVFCRYDFFPQLLNYARKFCQKRVLVSASLKGKNLKSNNPLKNFLNQYIYKTFDWIITTTFKDKSLFEIHFGLKNKQVQVCDFRFLRINKRQSQSSASLENKIAAFDKLNDFIANFPNRLIAGSFWANEGILFDNSLRSEILNKNLLLAIAPHELSTESIAQIKLNIKENLPSLEIYELRDDFSQDQVLELIEAMNAKAGVLIFNMKGVLCELYTLFNIAFVGGGHGRSVHSLLEPYLANCQLICGPKVHRSTEYDIILENSANDITIIETAKDFSKAVELYMQKNVNILLRSQLIQEMERNARQVEKDVFTHD